MALRFTSTVCEDDMWRFLLKLSSCSLVQVLETALRNERSTCNVICVRFSVQQCKKEAIIHKKPYRILDEYL
jgi:hypothetical protein